MASACAAAEPPRPRRREHQASQPWMNRERHQLPPYFRDRTVLSKRSEHLQQTLGSKQCLLRRRLKPSEFTRGSLLPQGVDRQHCSTQIDARLDFREFKLRHRGLFLLRSPEPDAASPARCGRHGRRAAGRRLC